METEEQQRFACCGSAGLSDGFLSLGPSAPLQLNALHESVLTLGCERCKLEL